MNHAQPGKKATLSDIAAAAGISKVTVSKVLSNNPGNNARCSEETRLKVLKIAEEMGYRANVAAKMLAGKSTRAIGVLLDVNSPPEHFLRVSKMQEEAEKSGYWLIIGECHPDLANISNFIEDFMTRGVDGFITIAHVHRDIGPKVMELFEQTGKPVVYYDMPPELMHCNAAYVSVDFAAGVKRAVEYLYQSGRRKMCLFMPRINLKHGNFHFITEREVGFAAGMDGCGLSYDIDFNYRNNCWGMPLDCRNIFPVVEKMLAEFHPDAIIAENDAVAAIILSYCHRHKIRVPEDIAVTGFDNLEFSGLIFPALTTFDPHTAQASKMAVEILLEMIKTGPAPVRRQEIFVPELMVREST